MKRHKRYYFEPLPDEDPSIHRIIMIWRKPKKRSRIRKCMYWAWQLQSDKQFIKKYFKGEE